MIKETKCITCNIGNKVTCNIQEYSLQQRKRITYKNIIPLIIVVIHLSNLEHFSI